MKCLFWKILLFIHFRTYFFFQKVQKILKLLFKHNQSEGKKNFSKINVSFRKPFLWHFQTLIHLCCKPVLQKKVFCLEKNLKNNFYICGCVIFFAKVDKNLIIISLHELCTFLFDFFILESQLKRGGTRYEDVSILSFTLILQSTNHVWLHFWLSSQTIGIIVLCRGKKSLSSLVKKWFTFHYQNVIQS
jgi:hypothetical protein